MPVYAYKAHINRKRELIWTHHEKELDDCRLTIELLQEIVGDNVFSVEESDAQFSNGCVICWSTSREETDEEYKARIERLEKYNAEVDRRRAAKKEAK